MKFTDENGAEFEVVGWPILPSDEQEFVIRPIQKPKWHVIWYDAPRGENYKAIEINLPASEDQAQLIKEAVESLMIYIHTPSKTNKEWLKAKAEKASDAIQKDSDD